jgi:hypothetical protein
MKSKSKKKKNQKKKSTILFPTSSPPVIPSAPETKDPFCHTAIPLSFISTSIMVSKLNIERGVRRREEGIGEKRMRIKIQDMWCLSIEISSICQ